MQLSIRVFTPTIWHYCTFVPQKTYASEVEEKHWQKSPNNLTKAAVSQFLALCSFYLLSALVTYLPFFFRAFLSLSHFLHCHQIFSFFGSFKASLNFQVASFNPGQNIWHKVKRYYKTGHQAASTPTFDVFLIFSNFLGS